MTFRSFIAACLVLGMGGASAVAGPAVLSNDDLAEVVGQEGISMVLHLQVNTSDAGSQALGASFTHSFNVNGTTTYATAQGLKGVIDLVGLTIDVAPRPDLAGGSYIDIGLPGVVAVNQFGFRSFGVQTDAQAAVQPDQNFGSVLLNGVGTQTGHLYLWAK